MVAVGDLAVTFVEVERVIVVYVAIFGRWAVPEIRLVVLIKEFSKFQLAIVIVFKLDFYSRPGFDSGWHI